MIRATIIVALLAATAAVAGPYVAVSPATSPLHLSYDYDWPGTSQDHHPDATLVGSAIELGWRVGRHWSLALDRLDTPDSLHGRRHEYAHALLRIDWYPQGSRWWVGAGLGVATGHGEALDTPYGDTFIASGSGFATALGVGYEHPLGRHWGARTRLEYLSMHNLSFDTTDRMNARGVRAGLLLVWRP